MNFASLLKHHEVRPLNSGNKLMVNCNSKSNHKNLVIQNVHSGLKRFNNSMVGQSLKQIFQKFEQDQTVQWILQLENMRIKLHKFKPSKIKNRKQQPQQSCNTQQNIQPNIQLNSKQKNNIFPKTQTQIKHQQTSPKSKRNYSPLHAKLQSNFTKQQNWNQNPNKFSFGDDQSFKIQQNQQEILNNQQYQTYQQLNKINHKGINLFQQFSAQIGQIQSTQKTNYTKLNLKQQDNNLLKNAQQSNNLPKKLQQRRIFNQLAQNESQNHQNIVKRSQANPDSLIDFNFDIGTSFQEINKAPLQNKLPSNKKMINTLSPKAEQNTIEKNVKADENSKAICEIDEFVIAPSVQATEKTSQVTSIKVLPSPIIAQPYQIAYPQNNSSPNRILCKAVVRNLTPQKFKYPRIQPKTQVQINGFNIQEENKSQGNIKLKQGKNIENQENLKQNQGNIIKQLIQESDKLMQERANKLIDNDDKIRRIVLHQAPQQNQAQLLKDVPAQQHSIPIVIVHSPPQGQKLQKQDYLNNQKANSIKVNSFSPCSPVQQKPKFHNQLANIDATYTSERKPLAPLSTNPLPQQKIPPQIQNLIPTQQSQYACKPIIPTVTYINNNHQVNQVNQFQPQEMPATTKTYIPYFPINNFKSQIVHQNAEVSRPLSYQPYTQAVRNKAQIVNQNNARGNDFIKINTNYTSPLQNYPSPPQNYQSSQLNYQNSQQNYQNVQHNYQGSQQNYQASQPNYQNGQLNYQGAQQNYQNNKYNYQSPIQNYTLTSPMTLPAQLDQKHQVSPKFLQEIDGIRYVQSQIYQTNPPNLIFPTDPKQSSIQFSLRIDEHFAPDNYLKH